MVLIYTYLSIAGEWGWDGPDLVPAPVPRDASGEAAQQEREHQDSHLDIHEVVQGTYAGDFIQMVPSVTAGFKKSVPSVFILMNKHSIYIPPQYTGNWGNLSQETHGNGHQVYEPKINLVTLTYVFVFFGCPHIHAPTCMYVYILVCISFTLGSTLGYAVDCAHLLHLRHGGNADDGQDCNSGTGLKICFYAFYIGSTSKKFFLCINIYVFETRKVWNGWF